ncbi:MAG: hypothetical protein NTZ78_04500 [Candidatus Aureabacteria bacterium]|nr:hypothetical protein [Candidatus Auribacterota bacterium]
MTGMQNIARYITKREAILIILTVILLGVFFVSIKRYSSPEQHYGALTPRTEQMSSDAARPPQEGSIIFSIPQNMPPSVPCRGSYTRILKAPSPAIDAPAPAYSFGEKIEPRRAIRSKEIHAAQQKEASEKRVPERVPPATGNSEPLPM